LARYCSHQGAAQNIDTTIHVYLSYLLSYKLVMPRQNLKHGSAFPYPSHGLLLLVRFHLYCTVLCKDDLCSLNIVTSQTNKVALRALSFVTRLHLSIIKLRGTPTSSNLTNSNEGKWSHTTNYVHYYIKGLGHCENMSIKVLSHGIHILRAATHPNIGKSVLSFNIKF
jgi:hypothetical protein